jgi:hypothetical protein
LALQFLLNDLADVKELHCSAGSASYFGGTNATQNVTHEAGKGVIVFAMRTLESKMWAKVIVVLDLRQVAAKSAPLARPAILSTSAW